MTDLFLTFFFFFFTAGQERYRAITTSYYRGAHGVIIAFDLTVKKSFEDVDLWFTEIEKNNFEVMPIILVGNKSDLKEQRAVSSEEAQEYSKRNKMMYIETSALDGSNIENCFLQLIDNITDNDSGFDSASNSKNEISQSEKIDLNENHEQSKVKEKSCCN